MTEDKLARLYELEHKLKWKGHLPAYETEEIIQFVREAWAEHKKDWHKLQTALHILQSENRPNAKYIEEIDKLREELAEYRNVLGWYANKGHPNSEWDKSLWWQHAEKVLDKWDRTTKE